MPWEKFPEIKHWYSRIKSRPSFRSILTDKIIGFPPRGNFALLVFLREYTKNITKENIQ